MKFLVALLALVACVTAAPSLANTSAYDMEALVKMHPEVQRGLVNILCAIVCDAIYITLEVLLNLSLQVILSALALPPDQMGHYILSVIGK